MLTILLAIWKYVGEKLSLKWLAALLMVLVAAGGCYLSYKYIATEAALKQKLDDQKLIDAANHDRDTAVANFKQYKASYDLWSITAHQANQEMVASLKETNSKIEAQLNDARYRAITAEGLLKNVPKFVTPKDDLACTIPSGFVQLYNRSLELGTASGYASGRDPFAGSPLAVTGTASGVPLSTVLSVSLYNHGVALSWRDVALGWQTWYVENKAAVDKAIAAAKAVEPVAPK